MYQRISALPDNVDELANPELAALTKIWLEQKMEMEARGDAYQEFLTKLRRQWAIETGMIERLYTWDRGVTEVLIEKGIDATLIA
ncbi:MAG: Fic family protein, partial [Nitrospirae bacterium]|nr:Fic family protein [Candidatus Troglogloeales bacterium]